MNDRYFMSYEIMVNNKNCGEGQAEIVGSPIGHIKAIESDISKKEGVNCTLKVIVLTKLYLQNDRT